MKKLFFDDVRSAPDSSWMVARDVEEAKRLMVEHHFAIMSLDHDIGYQMLCDECAEDTSAASYEDLMKGGCPHVVDGTDLAEWMVKELAIWPKLIIIHSGNPYGTERMRRILSGAIGTGYGDNIHVEWYSKQLYERIKVD